MAFCHHDSGWGLKKKWKEKIFTYLFHGPVALSDITTALKKSQDLFNTSLFLLELLHLKTLTTSASQLLGCLESLFSELDILDSQLLANDGQISDWVDISFNVNDLSIVEASYDLEDSIDGTDM